MEQHRQAVIGHTIGVQGNKLVFVVDSAYGVAVPEQLLLPISQCDSSVVSEDRIGFSILRSDDSWDRVVCSTAGETETHLLAMKAGLSRREVLPVSNVIRFNDAGVEITEPEPLAESSASGSELPEKDLVDPSGRQLTYQVDNTPGNAITAVLIALAAAVVVVLLVTTLTNKRAS